MTLVTTCSQVLSSQCFIHKLVIANMNKAIPFDPNLILALVASNTSGSNDEQLRDIYGDLRQRASGTNGDPCPHFEELWCSDLIAESMAIRDQGAGEELLFVFRRQGG